MQGSTTRILNFFRQKYRLIATLGVILFTLLQMLQYFGLPLLQNTGLSGLLLISLGIGLTASLLPQSSPSSSQTSLSRSNQPSLHPPELESPRCNRLFGRDTDSQELLTLLSSPSDRSVLYLAGEPGFGKTELARYVGKSALKQKLFTGSLWISARKTEFIAGNIVGTKSDLSPLDWQEFLYQSAAQLETPASAAQLKQLFSRQKLLIIIDNAETANLADVFHHLLPLLPQGRILVTSRTNLSLPFIQPYPVRGLSVAASFQLLAFESSPTQKSLPQLGQAISNHQIMSRIFKLTRGAPLALHFFVGLVHEYQDVESVLARFTGSVTDTKISRFYEYTLKDAFDHISATAKAILHFLGYLNSDAATKSDIADSLTLFQLPTRYLEDDLAALRTWHLLEQVEISPGQVRYDLHPWVRSSITAGLIGPSPFSSQQTLELLRQKLK